MWLFTIFYASTFAIGVESEGNDILSYMALVPTLNKLDLSLTGIVAYYVASGEIDIARVFLAYIVSYFTDNGYYLIIVFGIIYGYFYSRNMWYILDRLENKTKSITTILLICLFLTIPIWNINGFRFWVASHVFIFGLLPFLFEGKKKPLIWCFLAPFVFHFSLMVALVPLVIYLTLGNRIYLYLGFFIITIFVSEINLESLNNFMEANAPASLVEKTAGYRNEENVETLRSGEFRQDSVWYARYYKNSLNYALMFFLLMFFWISKKEIKSNISLLKLLSFIFLFCGFANILSTLPSGYRFLTLANLLTIAFLALHIQNNKVNRDLVRLFTLITPFLLFFIIITLRMSWYSVSIMSLIGNPLTVIFTFGENISMNDIIKGL